MGITNKNFSRMLAIFVFVGLWTGTACAKEAPKGTKIVVYRVPTDRKVVALTFDDGPDPIFTVEALSILEHEKVHATFFDVGERALAHPEIVMRELLQGHAIGSHTYSHVLLTRFTNEEAMDQVRRGAEAIESIIGRKPMLFRPPWGKCQPEVLDQIAAEGYDVVAWTVTLEHKSLTTPKELADRVVARTHPGFIILMHDGTSEHAMTRDMSIAALPILISELRKQGYSFVTVPELLAIGKEKEGPAYEKVYDEKIVESSKRRTPSTHSK